MAKSLSPVFPDIIYVIIGDDFASLHAFDSVEGLEEQPVATYKRQEVGDIVVTTTFEPQTN